MGSLARVSFLPARPLCRYVMCIYVYIYIYIHTHTHTYILYIYIYIHTYVYVYIYIERERGVCVYTYIYIYMYCYCVCYSCRPSLRLSEARPIPSRAEEGDRVGGENREPGSQGEHHECIRRESDLGSDELKRQVWYYTIHELLVLFFRTGRSPFGGRKREDRPHPRRRLIIIRNNNNLLPLRWRSRGGR